MAYTIEAITLRDNMAEDGMARITEVWADIVKGRIPLLFDSDGKPRNHVSPITRYTTWDEKNPAAEAEFTILAVTPDFFKEMETRKDYVMYQGSGDDVGEAAEAAWMQAAADEKAGKITLLRTDDYESTVPPEYTKNGKWACYVYAHIKEV